MSGLARATWAVFAREWRLAARQPAEWSQPAAFYVLIAVLFPLAMNARNAALAEFAPAVVWVGAVLASLLGLERLFRMDYEDGTLEQLILADAPAALLVFSKLLAQWVLIAGPLILMAPLIGLAMRMEGRPVSMMVIGLILGTPTLVFTGGFAAALTVGAPKAGVLIPILVLPLMVPVVVFGAGAVQSAQSGLSAEGPLYFLGALLLLGLTLLPWATAGALRNALE